MLETNVSQSLLIQGRFQLLQRMEVRVIIFCLSQSLLIQGRFQLYVYKWLWKHIYSFVSQSLLIQGRFQQKRSVWTYKILFCFICRNPF